MFKTKEQIEEMADNLYGEDAKNGDSWRYHTYIAVYAQAQQDIKEEYEKEEEAWLITMESKDRELQEKDEEIEKLSGVIAKTSQYNKLAQDEIIELKKALQLIYDNSRANYIDKESREEFRQIVDKYKLHKY